MLLFLTVSCSSSAELQNEQFEPQVHIRSVDVQGPMPVVMAENMVKEALPTLLACWTEDQPPCGTITVSHQGTRHGHRKKSVEGSLQSPEFRQCVEDIISKIRPPTPELASPESGLTVTLVYTPSDDKRNSCS